MEVILDPPRGAAGVQLGSTVSEAERALSRLPHYEGPGRSKGGRGVAHFANGMTIHAHGDRNGIVEAVEIYRPLDKVTRVVYDGISIFGDRADVVEVELACRLRLEVINDGSTLVAPDAFLALGKSLSESGYFDSVVVAAPGYYDDIALPPESEFHPAPPHESQLDGQEGLF